MDDITVSVLNEDNPCQISKTAPHQAHRLAPSVLSQPCDTGSVSQTRLREQSLDPMASLGGTRSRIWLVTWWVFVGFLGSLTCRFQWWQKNQEMSVFAQGLTPPDPIDVADTKERNWMMRHRHQAQNLNCPDRYRDGWS